jgi:protein O-GlcNAc transferase
LETLREATQLHFAGELAQAEKLYLSVLAMEPHHPEAWRLLGLLKYQQGESKVGLAMMHQAATLFPQNAEAFRVLGKTLLEQGDYPNATVCFERAVGFHPKDLGFQFALVQLYALEGKHDAVCRHCQLVLSIDPTLVEAYNYFGLALKALGDQESSLKAFARSLEIQPLFVDGMVNAANILQQQGRLEEASRLYRRAILVRPEGPSTYNNLGCVLDTQGQTNDAIQTYREAIRLDPNYANAFLNLGNAYGKQKEYALAKEAYRQSLQLNPSSRAATNALTEQMQHLCDWSEIYESANRVREMVVSKQPWSLKDLVSPFSFTCLPTATTSAEQLRVATQWGSQFVRPAVPFYQLVVERNDELLNFPSPVKRVRIGYLSADFFNHATAWLISEMLEQHDRNRFEIFGYSIGKHDESHIGLRVIQAFDTFRDLSGMSHQEAAENIASDAIDVLIDLKGYTHGARTQILAYRPAPIQVNYLGYPGTMGVEFIDYIFVDEVVVPRDRAPHYREQLVYLPGCYQVNDSTDGPVAPLPLRRDWGLPEEAIVCCSFNSSYKYHPEMFAIWMRLLKANPRAVLWLLEHGPQIAVRMRKFAESFGVAGERLIFTESVPHQEHLARISLSDLFLDSYPVNAHTTASDALRVGLPILTLSGEAFVSRVAGSLLTTVGLPELIATSFEEYEDKAMQLLGNPDQIASLRKKLSYNVQHSELFNGKAFARKIEVAYEQIWQVYCSKQAAESQAQHQLGYAYFRDAKFEQASAVFRKAIFLDPRRADNYLNAGICYERVNRSSLAKTIYLQAIEKFPRDARFQYRLGRMHSTDGNRQLAKEAFQKSLELKADYAEPRYELSEIFEEEGESELAAEYASQAIAMNPELGADHAANLLQQVCRWEEAEVFAQKAVDRLGHVGTEEQGESVFPFAFICLPIETSPALQFQRTMEWVHLLGMKSYRTAHHFDSNPKLRQTPGRLRIGYLSSDFCEHATACLIGEMLEKHDRNSFEVIAYSIGPDDKSPRRQRLIRAVDRFYDLCDLNNTQAAQHIADDEVHILVDLKGYTRHARPEILIQRPAPIQVNYLGYPGTMGLDCIDYIFADEYVAPLEHQPFFRERILHIPGCYQVNDSTIMAEPSTSTRTECGLPEDALVCCSFNGTYKLTPTMFQTWMRILKANKSAVLWLLDSKTSVADRLRMAASAQGIDPERLVFAQRVAHAKNLARLGLADLFLDSFPVNAHTTASDALRMGVPVLTLTGKSFVSRVAGSLLNHLGMNQLITKDFEAYEATANTLLQSRSILDQTKQSLRMMLSRTDLFDGEVFARKIEKLYREIWENYQRQRSF